MMLKLHVFVLPEVSTAVQVTVLVPRANVEPEAGAQFVDAMPQLSLAVGAENVTTALVMPAATLVVMLA
jgi:hypothetical protein